MSITTYLRKRFMPHIWCAGCGNGIVLNSLLRAVEKLGLDRNNIVMVSGIGCSSRMQGYVDFHTLHTIHGRALAFATGVKLARPELDIIVPMGDGDALAIGGNHFIHAARRNINLTAIILNNRIYGMTGGQYSPLTGMDKYATTAPYGTIVPSFDTVELAKAAGASFVARSTVYHVLHLTNLLEKAIKHKGFAVVEVLTQCPTYYGRKNGMPEAPEMMQWFKDHTFQRGTEPKKIEGEMIEIGLFVEEQREEYCERYEKSLQKVGKV